MMRSVFSFFSFVFARRFLNLLLSLSPYLLQPPPLLPSTGSPRQAEGALRGRRARQGGPGRHGSRLPPAARHSLPV